MFWSDLLNPKRVRMNSSVKKTESDTRSPFKKDFDTVCNCSGIRRLQDKAQVFPLEHGDYARTRLTHSIEVMSIAESLAMGIRSTILKHEEYICHSGASENQLNVDDVKKLIDDIPIILKTAAFLHDMGNPPFGHLGEQIIRDWFTRNIERIVEKDGKYIFSDAGNVKSIASKMSMEQLSDLKNFEGNAQLLRLVTKLSFIVDNTGMNLSFPVLAAFIKYPCQSADTDSEILSKKKVGYFNSEADIFQQIESALKLNNCRHPLAFLLEAADDIAYLSADIEDAQKKGILPVETLRKYLLDEQEAKDEDKKPLGEDPLIRIVLEGIDDYYSQAKSQNYPDVDDAVIHRARVLIKGRMIDAIQTAFENQYSDIMSGTCEVELLSVSNANRLQKVLRKIEKERIYYCSSIVESKTRAFTIINKLLDSYVIAVLNYKKSEDENKDTSNNLLYLSLSTNYRYICEKANEDLEKNINAAKQKKAKNASNEQIIKRNEGTILYNKLLLVTDQISGMTDSCAMSTYNTLTATNNL